MISKKNAVCFGEILWDVFIDDKKVGGAPLNLALRMQSFGINTSIVSQLGNDSLGIALKHFIEKRNVSTQLISITQNYPTSEVKVSLNKKGIAEYVIEYPCAWDKIQNNSSIEKAVINSDLFIYGSLASRDEVSRKTLMSLINISKFNAFDVNLRPPHYEISIIKELMHKADFIKLNEEELELISRDLGSKNKTLNDNIKFISIKTDTKMICVSKGEKGAVLYINGIYYSQDGFKVKVIDTVGSGDSFLAALLTGVLNKQPFDLVLKKACAIGALVASESGANPIIEENYLNKFIESQ